MDCKLPRKIAISVTSIAVTITGTGDADYCYATIGGTKRYGAGTYTVQPGDTIIFGVHGAGTTQHGIVKINNTTVLEIVADEETYSWKVPDDTKAISVVLTFVHFREGSQISVTTA